jgi:hypothetical protein
MNGIITRRQTLALMGGTMLAGCSGTATPPIATVTADVVADLSQIATGFETALPALVATTPPVLPATTLATVETDTNQVITLAKQVTAVTTASAALPTVQQIGADLNAVVGIAAGIVPPPYGTMLAAAAVLLPIIETTLQGLLGTITPPAASAKLKSAALPTMTPAQARAAIAAVIAGGH